MGVEIRMRMTVDIRLTKTDEQDRNFSTSMSTCFIGYARGQQPVAQEPHVALLPLSSGSAGFDKKLDETVLLLSFIIALDLK